MELNANLINQIYGLITNVSLSWFDIKQGSTLWRRYS